MRNLLAYILPPAAGALIGYLTNAVAIRMLFRPLKKITVAGIALPFTPGVLPRERGRLADSIGVMVERELLTPRTLAERLNRPEIRDRLKKVSSAAVEGRAAEWYPEAVSNIIAFLSTPEIRKTFESRGRAFLKKTILSLNVLQRFVIAAAKYDRALDEKMPRIVEDSIHTLEELLRSGGIREKLLAFMREDSEKMLDGFSISEEQTASLLDTVNVRALVRDRINSLEMIQVEKIILDVMADKFQLINLFGALIGALIGFLQIALSFL